MTKILQTADEEGKKLVADVANIQARAGQDEEELADVRAAFGMVDEDTGPETEATHQKEVALLDDENTDPEREATDQKESRRQEFGKMHGGPEVNDKAPRQNAIIHDRAARTKIE